MEQKLIYLGIDWADDHHDIVITDDSAKTLNQFQIDHTPDGFAQLHANIANYQKSPADVLIAIETNRGLLVHELIRTGYTVYAINPKAVNRYKDRHVLSQAKSYTRNAHIFIDFLKACPYHDTLRACKKNTFLAFIKKHRYPYPGKIEELWETIQ